MNKHGQLGFKLMLNSVALSLLGLSHISYGGTASNTFNFTATFVGGTCEINVPTSVQFNSGNILRATDIEQKTSETQKEFEITLANCTGWGLTPSIKVQGSKTADFGEQLFRDIMGPLDANGYGVLLESRDNNTFEANSNLAAQGVISAKNWSPDTQLNTIDTTIRMIASLSCGDCNYQDRHGGAFKSTVTFDFIYE